MAAAGKRRPRREPTAIGFAQKLTTRANTLVVEALSLTMRRLLTIAKTFPHVTSVAYSHHLGNKTFSIARTLHE